MLDQVRPNNITLLYLPPYSPERNPKENLWDKIREKIFKNYALKSMDAVRAKLKQVPLYRAQSKACPLHQLLPLYRQLTLM
jgi:transposase